MRLPIFFLLLLAGSAVAADDMPSLHPVTEVRNGRTGVFGLQANLCWAIIRHPSELKNIRITEKKTGKDISQMFDITSANSGTIIMRFRDGKGDFGSENTAVVSIPAAIFDPPFNRDDLVLETSTDAPSSVK